VNVMKAPTFRRAVFILVSIGCINGCGGGSGNTNNEAISLTPPLAPETSQGGIWEPGVFEEAENFAGRCVTPRSGVDPFTGERYPDIEGTAFEEKMWMRSWTNNTYLWYDEVDDNDPADFTVASYFAQLKTNGVTTTGSAKDNFHFSQSTDEYNTLAQTGVTSSYGFSWEFISSVPPRQLLVRYTEPNSPAALAGVPRGASLVRINNVDFVNNNTQTGVDALNQALFPSQSGETATFEFSLIDGSSLTVTLTSQDIVVSPVQNVRVIEAPAGKTGYLQFNTFNRTAQDELIASFEQFLNENITELVIDLRYNGGGLLALASQLSYMIAGPNQTNNMSFETLQFNDKHPEVDPITGIEIQPTPFYQYTIDYTAGKLTDTLLPSVSLTKLYVITTGATCSASEAVINALRGINVEVVQIGTPTCGKPYGFYPTDNCGTTYFSIQFQGVNEKGFGDYADGFIPSASPQLYFETPGCLVADDFHGNLGEMDEGMLSAALAHAATGACPIAAVANNIDKKSAAQHQNGLSIKRPDALKSSIFLHNKIVVPIDEHN
jgi:hypothetical protein